MTSCARGGAASGAPPLKTTIVSILFTPKGWTDNDRTGTALILIGMPGIEKRFAHYPLLYKHPGRRNLYIALAGPWVPDESELYPQTEQASRVSSPSMGRRRGDSGRDEEAAVRRIFGITLRAAPVPRVRHVHLGLRLAAHPIRR